MSALEALASGSLQLPTRPAQIEAAATDAATVLVFVPPEGLPPGGTSDIDRSSFI